MIEQLKNRTALVTGGTDGIGKEVALRLANLGVRIVIVGRHAEKGMHAAEEIRTASRNKYVEFMQADLSSVREALLLGDCIANRRSGLHYLVHSAGMIRGRFALTAEGIESNFATNYLSRFALTVCLLPVLQAEGGPADPSRVVLVSHPGFNGPIHYDDLNLLTNFSTIRAFKQFHYANDVFAIEFARRLRMVEDLPSVTISSFHPGPTKTNIDREMPAWMKFMVRHVMHRLISRPPEVPAKAILNLLLADGAKNDSGKLFSRVGKLKRLPQPPNALRDGAKLWAISEKLVSSASEAPLILPINSQPEEAMISREGVAPAVP